MKQEDTQEFTSLIVGIRHATYLPLSMLTNVTDIRSAKDITGGSIDAEFMRDQPVRHANFSKIWPTSRIEDG